MMNNISFSGNIISAKNKDYVEGIYKSSAEIAGKIAEHTMRKVRKKVGFTAV